MKIGYNNKGYPVQRNLLSLSIPGVQYVNVKDIFSFPNQLFYRLKIKSANKTRFLNSFNDFDINRVDGYHFFNVISYGRKPWVTTFETTLPRWGKDLSQYQKFKGFDLLARDECRKLFALSTCAADILKSDLESTSYSLGSQIIEKIEILHPPQQVVSSSVRKNSTNEVVFTLIGSDFFRKGGKEILQVFQTLQKKGLNNWHLNIISKLEYGDYASKTSKLEYLEALKSIAVLNDKVTHLYTLPNEKVLEILEHTDIGLLPTYDDTYGYSVLEAQAAGCPVITTDIRALPEINNNEIGWLLNVPKTDLGYGILMTELDRISFSTILYDQLLSTIQSILNGSIENIRIKGEKCIKKIISNHNPLYNRKRLSQCYTQF